MGDTDNKNSTGNIKTDTVAELSFNVDDMTGEEISFAMERFFEGGAVDVFTVPIGMKKSRPGVMITVLCHEDIKEKMAGLIFRYTSTLGIRKSVRERYIMDRKNVVLNTPYGDVNAKVAEGYGIRKIKPEYEDVAKIAQKEQVSIGKARDMILKPDV